MNPPHAPHHRLKALARPLQMFVNSWGAESVRRLGRPVGAELPAVYALAAIKGEGILRQRFFGPFLQLLEPLTLDAAQQLALWQELVEGGGHITQWVQRLGLAKALRSEAALPEALAQESRWLYCVLLCALAGEPEELMQRAVERFFWHVWISRFPTAANPTPAPHRVQTHAQRLLRALRKRYAEPVELRESFKPALAADGKAGVDFRLLIKRRSSGQWEELIALSRARLRAAKLAAYQEALRELNKAHDAGVV